MKLSKNLWVFLSFIIWNMGYEYRKSYINPCTVPGSLYFAETLICFTVHHEHSTGKIFRAYLGM